MSTGRSENISQTMVQPAHGEQLQLVHVIATSTAVVHRARLVDLHTKSRSPSLGPDPIVTADLSHSKCESQRTIGYTRERLVPVKDKFS